MSQLYKIITRNKIDLYELFDEVSKIVPRDYELMLGANEDKTEGNALCINHSASFMQFCHIEESGIGVCVESICNAVDVALLFSVFRSALKIWNVDKIVDDDRVIDDFSRKAQLEMTRLQYHSVGALLHALQYGDVMDNKVPYIRFYGCKIPYVVGNDIIDRFAGSDDDKRGRKLIEDFTRIQWQYGSKKRSSLYKIEKPNCNRQYEATMILNNEEKVMIPCEMVIVAKNMQHTKLVPVQAFKKAARKVPEYVQIDELQFLLPKLSDYRWIEFYHSLQGKEFNNNKQ